MGILTKLKTMLLGGSAVEKGIASAVMHILDGDTPAAVTDILTLVEIESGNHPYVKAEMLKIQTALANAGLAFAPTLAPTPAPVTPAVAPPAPAVQVAPAAPAFVEPQPVVAQPAPSAVVQPPAEVVAAGS